MHVLHIILLWLDRSPGHYRGVACAMLGLTVASAVAAWVAPQKFPRWNRPAVFGALLILTLFAFRWPVIFDNQQAANPDESQSLADVITLRSDLVYWKRVDGTTQGPLAQWTLALAGRAGMRLDYTNARVFSALLMAVMLIATWRTLVWVFDDGRARLLVLPAVALEATTLFWDFTQHSSEHLPLALLAVATWLLTLELFPVARFDRPGRFALAGVLLGCVPFAKLQAVPIGLWIGGSALVAVGGLARNQPWALRARIAGWLIGGALLPALLILAMVLVHREWTHFWSAYILNNLIYAGDRWFTWAQSPAWLFKTAAIAGAFPTFLVPMLALLVVGTIAAGRRAATRFTVFAVGLLAAAYIATMAPGRAFQHYLQFLIAPLALAVGAFWGHALVAPSAATGTTGPRARRWLSLGLAGGFAAAAMGFQFHAWAASPVSQIGQYGSSHGRLSRRTVSVLLRRLAKPGDELALWGWMPAFFVETGLPHATREAHTYRQIISSRMIEYYRARYLDDLRRADPAFFIDAVGGDNFVFHNRATEAHEIFPELARHIATRYVLLTDTEGTRVYVRRDRAPDAS